MIRIRPIEVRERLITKLYLLSVLAVLLTGNASAQQAVTTMAALETAIGHAIGIVVVVSYAYAVVVMLSALIAERGDGTWKLGLIRGIAIFACTGVAQILLTIFFPGVQIIPSFA